MKTLKVKRLLGIVCCFVLLVHTNGSLYAQEGRKVPAMGFASWNQFGVNINENVIKGQADAMVSSGLADVGFEYINIDDGFFDGRNADGTLRINSTKFPNGMKYMADYIHSKGLKAGFYSEAGENTCGSIHSGQPGGVGGGFYGHDQQDADLYFKTWGFDFIKVDYCGGLEQGLDEETRYTAIKNAIDNTGKSIHYNVCRWQFPGTWVTKIADSWRMSRDINFVPGSTPNWTVIMEILDINTYLAPYCSPGHYNDMDMLEVGRGLPYVEDKSHFTMWCILSSPLLLGNNLTSMSSQTISILTNEEIIALNQDTTGYQAHLISDNGSGLQVWAKPLNGRQSLERGVVLFNRSASTQTMTVNWSDLNLEGSASVRDLWEHSDLGDFESSYSTSVPSHGVVALKIVGTKATLQETFEAEYAWLNNFNLTQNTGIVGNQGRASKDANCSRGAKASYIGNRADNYLEFLHVYSKVAGEYTLTISYLSGENRNVTVGVNGVNQNLTGLNSGGFATVKDVTLPVTLKKGYNIIRLSNATGFAPDIDKIHLDLNKNLADVTVTVQADKEIYETGETAALSASATINGGTITKVSFYNGNELLGEDASEPYSFQWEGLTEGTYSITAVATDNAGVETSSAPVSIRVVVPQGPYGGIAATIPGKIELENYDVGGNEFAYYDTDAGTNVDPAPNFRTDEDVDIETCTDTGGGYNLGWTAAGEWLEYTVNVEKTGTYTLTIRAACNGDDRTISLSTNGSALVNDVAIPNTGGWQEWTNVIVENVELTAGTQVLRLTIGETDFVNLNYLFFENNTIPPNPIQLTEGWNLIGCSLEGSTNLQTAFSGIWENVISVKDMNNFYVKNQPEFLNSLKAIVWGHGYLLKVNQNCELVWNP